MNVKRQYCPQPLIVVKRLKDTMGSKSNNYLPFGIPEAEDEPEASVLLAA